MVRKAWQWLPHRPLVAAAALLATGLTDTADAQIHHRYRHYQRGGQYQYCPPSDYSTSPYIMPGAPGTQPSEGAGVPGQPGVGPQPSTATPGTQPSTDPGTDTTVDPAIQNAFDQATTQAPAAPSTSSIASAPANSAANMIGDFFGGIGASSVLIPAQTRSFSGFYLNPDNTVSQFSAAFANGTIVLTPTGTLTLTGDAGPIPLPPGTTWQSVQTFTPPTFPSTFAVAENPDETAGTQQAFPNAGDIVFNGGHADQISGNLFSLFTDYTIIDSPAFLVSVPSPGTSVVGRVKMSENVSPIPRDRVFMNYSHFNNVALLPQGVDVDRFVPGFEKTFFGGIMSAEMRFPFASTLNPDIVADGATSDDEVVFGNMSAIFKTLVYQDSTLAIAGGLQVAMPTGDDVRVLLMNGTELVRVENESVHLMPYVGALYTPNDRFFAQGFIQVDADANGNPVFIGGNGVGDLDDATFMYFDASFGYWMYRSCGCSSSLTGVAPIFEVHWNTTVEDTNSVGAGGFRVGVPGQDIDIVNLVFGSVFEFNHSTTLTAAYATPVSDDEDFDGELRVIFNHRFGPQSRASRAQF